MKHEALDLSKMTTADLFKAKAERRRHLANLPFEQKIEIVKKLYPLTQVGFLTLVMDLLDPICLDLSIKISRFSGAMMPHYERSQWLYDINQHVVTIKRWLMRREESVQGWQDSSFKPALVFGAELRAAIDNLRTESDKPAPSDSSEAQYLRQRLPITFLPFEAGNGIWIAEWFVDPVLTQGHDYVLFDIKFNRDIPTNIEKRLQIQLHMGALSEDPTKNLSLIQPYIRALLEGFETFGSVRLPNESDIEGSKTV